MEGLTPRDLRVEGSKWLEKILAEKSKKNVGENFLMNFPSEEDGFKWFLAQ